MNPVFWTASVDISADADLAQEADVRARIENAVVTALGGLPGVTSVRLEDKPQLSVIAIEDLLSRRDLTGDERDRIIAMANERVKPVETFDGVQAK